MSTTKKFSNSPKGRKRDKTRKCLCVITAQGCNEPVGRRNDTVGMGHSFTAAVNCHFHLRSWPAVAFVDLQHLRGREEERRKGRPRVPHRIDCGSPVALCDARPHCRTIETCLLSPISFCHHHPPSALLDTHPGVASGPTRMRVHQNASDLTKRDVGLVFAQFRSPIVRSALE